MATFFEPLGSPSSDRSRCLAAPMRHGRAHAGRGIPRRQRLTISTSSVPWRPRNRRATRPAVASVCRAAADAGTRPRRSTSADPRDNPDLPDSKGGFRGASEQPSRIIRSPSTSWRSNTLGPGTRAPWSFCASPRAQDFRTPWRQFVSAAAPPLARNRQTSTEHGREVSASGAPAPGWWDQEPVVTRLGSGGTSCR